MPTSPLSDWLKLLHIPGLGPRAYLRLLDHFNNEPDIILGADTDQLMAAGINQKIAHSVVKSAGSSRHEKDLAWLESSASHHIITLGDTDYPPQLKETPNCPPVLFVKGMKQEMTRNPSISIVGSRNATKFGEMAAFDIAKSLSKYGITVVSGLAYGIDSSAHQGCLADQSTTLAVLAHGLDIIYPRAHKQLSRLICKQGALVSEFPPGTKPLAGFFPRRNRIISGLCLGTVVVEAAQRSGSLITAQYALEQNREVFAVPGSIHSRQSQGCHTLIQSGAKLVCCAEDILSEFYPDRIYPHAISGNQTEVESLSRELVDLLATIEVAPGSIDQIVEKSGLTPDKVSSMLIELEVSGHVLCTACGHYSKVSNGIM